MKSQVLEKRPLANGLSTHRTGTSADRLFQKVQAAQHERQAIYPAEPNYWRITLYLRTHLSDMEDKKPAAYEYGIYYRPHKLMGAEPTELLRYSSASHTKAYQVACQHFEEVIAELGFTEVPVPGRKQKRAPAHDAIPVSTILLVVGVLLVGVALISIIAPWYWHRQPFGSGVDMLEMISLVSGIVCWWTSLHTEQT
jgi:hypothetical protein